MTAPFSRAETLGEPCSVAHGRHRSAARDHRRIRQHKMIRGRWGTLMRHVLLPGAPAAAPRRVVHAAAPARLIALAGIALGLLSGLPRTTAGTVNLSAVATAADEHLSPATHTQKQPAGRLLRSSRVWTVSATGGMLPRHACSARCGARRRSQTWRFRSAPRLPSGRLSPRHCAPHQPPLCARRGHSLWICGQRKGVAHMPTGGSKQQPASNFDCLRTATGQTRSSTVGAPRHAASLSTTAPSSRRSWQPFTGLSDEFR